MREQERVKGVRGQRMLYYVFVFPPLLWGNGSERGVRG